MLQHSQLQVHLQGNLQYVFDALFELGVIEPVLKMDWKPKLREMESGSFELANAILIVNQYSNDRLRLKAELEKLDRQALEILAMEVAREYAGFHSRDELH